MKYKIFTEEEWSYFCSKINFGKSFLDAKAIQIMNQSLHEVDGLIYGLDIKKHDEVSK